MDSLRLLGFELEEPIGEGLSGRVFRGRRTGGSRPLAIKICHPSERHSAEFVSFNLEYYFLSHLEHPHIVRAHAFGEIDEERRYYVMDYVPAVPLRLVYERGGLEAVGEVALAVCEALEYAHAQGILHGDIKPANVLVAQRADGRVEEVRLTDFGLASYLGDGSRQMVQGTLAYLSPEQLGGWFFDVRADLYSLGVTLYECLSGELPSFTAGNGDRPRLGDRLPRLDPGWATLVDELTAYCPSERPPSASAVTERIRALLGRGPQDGEYANGTAVLGPSLRLIGRDEPLQVLRGLLEEGGHTVIVTGPEGVGKTRLLAEFAHRAAVDGAHVYRSRAGQDRGAGFGMLRHLHHGTGTLGLTLPQAGGGTAAGRESSGSHPSGAPVMAPAEEAVAFAGELERLADQLLPDESDGTASRVLVFDELGDADLDSLDFLRTLRRRLGGSKALLCLVVGPGEEFERVRSVMQEAGGDEEVRILSIGPLPQPQVNELLQSILGSPTLGSQRVAALDEEGLGVLSGWMMERTAGNPSLVESALHDLHRSRILTRNAAGWKLERRQLRERTIPLTAEAAALEGLGTLEPATRRLLELASAFGPSFDVGLLASGDVSEGEELATFLAHSFRRGVLGTVPGTPHRYRFLNPAAARAIYAQLSSERRRNVHATIARFLEGRPPEGRSTGDLARHLEEAGETRRARECYLAAARENQAAGAFKEAARAYQSAWETTAPEERGGALDFCPEWVHALFIDGQFLEAADLVKMALGTGGDDHRDARARLRVLRAMCLAEAGRAGEAVEELARLLREPDAVATRALEAWALVEMGWYLFLARESSVDAIDILLRARGIAASVGDGRVKGRAELRLGILSWHEQHLEEAMDWLNQARDTFGITGTDDQLPAVWGNLALCHWNRLETAKAIEYHRNAAEGFARKRRRSEAARCFQNLASALLDLGCWQEAEEALKQADHWSRSTRTPRRASFHEYARAKERFLRGEIAGAERHALQAHQHALDQEQAYVRIGPLLLLAQIEILRGRLAEGRVRAQEAAGIAEQAGDPWGVCEGRYLVGWSWLLGHQAGEADRWLAKAEESAEEAQLAPVSWRIYLARAESAARRGERAESVRQLARARQLLERSHSELWEGERSLAEGCCLAFLEDHDAAIQPLARAKEIFTRLGAEPLRARTLEAMARVQRALGHRAAAGAALRERAAIRKGMGLDPALGVPEADDPSEVPSSGTTRVIEAVAEVSRSILTLTSLEQVLRKVLEQAVSYLGAERGALALVDPVTGELELRCVHNMDSGSVTDVLEISRSVLTRVGREGSIVFVGDALADPDLSARESIRKFRIRSLLAAPLRLEGGGGKAGRILGMVYVDDRHLTDLFGPEELKFVQMIASMAALAIQAARRLETAESRAEHLRGAIEKQAHVFPNTVGRSDEMQRVFRKLEKAARRARVILLTGETGVGKDHLARLVHQLSGRKGQFVQCLLTSLTASLVKSEIFGIVKRTATGVDESGGYVGSAQEGTLFFNEIADVPYEVLGTLLGLLDGGEYTRVGDSGRPRRFEGLIICATNKDLRQRVHDHEFPADLYQRLREYAVEIPPLRERRGDIPELVELFLRGKAAEFGEDVPVMTPKAMEMLKRYPWAEGNIRELKFCVRRAYDEAEGGVISPRHIEFEDPGLLDGDDWETSEEWCEEEAIRLRRTREALIQMGGLVAAAARLLGITEGAVRARIRKYGLEHLVADLRAERREEKKRRNRRTREDDSGS